MPRGKLPCKISSMKFTLSNSFAFCCLIYYFWLSGTSSSFLKKKKNKGLFAGLVITAELLKFRSTALCFTETARYLFQCIKITLISSPHLPTCYYTFQLFSFVNLKSVQAIPSSRPFLIILNSIRLANCYWSLSWSSPLLLLGSSTME